MQLDLWSLIILLFLAQGIFCLAAIWWPVKERPASGRLYLSLLILVLLWIMAEFLSVRNVFKIQLNAFYGTRYGSWFLLGPLVYFFLRAITEKDWQFRRRELLHFLPFLIFTLLIPAWSGEELGQRQIHYGMLAVFDHRPKVVSGFERLYAHIFYLQFLHFAVYLLYNLRQIRHYRDQLAQIYASRAHLNWLWVFHGLLLLALVFAASFLFILFRADFYSRSLDYLYILPMGLFVYSVGFQLTRIKWIRVANPSKSRYRNSTIKSSEREDFRQRLIKHLAEVKPYLKNELRLAELAQEINISSHQLSQLINEDWGQSFFDFINTYRVQEAKKLIVDHPHWTLLQIAFAAGFNNKTSFGNAFKKQLGVTPSTYRKEQLKQP
ncbi:MAG: helix-turn-helix domain-containing protein [Bacteroidota bacterium]